MTATAPNEPSSARLSTTELRGLAAETMDWDATETRARLVAREVSALEVVEAAITRAELLDPQLGAIVHTRYDEARAAARSPGTGRFAGVPTFVKDMEDLEGAPTRFGSASLVAPRVAARTAESVAELLTTGLVPLGKSTTSEFGLNASTEPVGRTPTKNPLDLRCSSGGSSGGAAALVAARVVPIGHGGDGGGSIRIPSAFCGLVGLKATRGRLRPMATTKRMPVKLATYGVLTRTVRDTAAVFAELDRAPIPGMAPIGLVEGPGRARLRVGIFIDPPRGSPVHTDVRAATLAAAKVLEGAGHVVDFVPAPYGAEMVEDFFVYWAFLAATVAVTVRHQLGGDPSRLEPWTRSLGAHARENWWKIPTALYRLQRYRSDYARTFARCDVVLSPTTAGPAPRIGHLSPALSFDELRERLLALLPYTPIQNASGAPAISVPWGTTSEGHPIGLQLAAPWGEERRLLELAFTLVPR
ncbi:amidase [Myxococcota bacterium]|nr:amidase [Myxococcota bacterium]